MNKIIFPIGYYPDPTKGKPISGGSLYIGQPDTDPEVVGNQKTVQALQENGSYVNITQPILTSAGGVPLYNGSPVSLYVLGDYSLKLLDSKGSQVYYVPSNEPTDSGDIFYFDTVDDMVAADLTVGNVYKTKGYHEVGDGGGAAYLIKTAAEYGGTPDGYGDHFDASGNVAVLQKNTEISARQFGAVGDGITDDYGSVQAYFTSELMLNFTDGNYLCLSPIVVSKSSDFVIKGRNATLTYGGSHTEYFISISLTGTSKVILKGFNIDGSKLCNKPIEILNNTSMSTPTRLLMSDMHVDNTKRNSSFLGGDGVLVRGAFDEVVLKRVNITDCELPTGQGTPGVIGISGLTVTYYSDTAFVKRCTLDNVDIEKVYSSDLTYTSDQDGVRFFAPQDTVDTQYKIESTLVVKKSKFINCYGRSIKTQCRNTIIDSSVFNRNEGFTGFTGNGEIDSQYGTLMLTSCVFDYKDGYQPRSCANASSNNVLNKDGVNIRDCEVFLDGSTTLEIFAQVFPSGGTQSFHIVKGNKIHGTVEAFFEFLCNGDDNHATIEDNYIEKIVDRDGLGLNLIYVKTSGVTSPFLAYVYANRNYYGDTDTPYLVRDGVPSVSMSAQVSAYGNYGFTDSIATTMQATGQKGNNALRAGRLGGVSDTSGFFDIQTFNIAAGATQAVSVRNVAGCVILINVVYNNQAYALISSQSTLNTTISAGTAFGVGNAADPGAGLFRVWSTGANAIAIRNTDASSRIFTVFSFVPN